MEPKGSMSLTEPKRWSDQSKSKEWSSKVMDGRLLTKAGPDRQGSPGGAGGMATVEARERGAKVEPMCRRSEADSGSLRL